MKLEKEYKEKENFLQTKNRSNENDTTKTNTFVSTTCATRIGYFLFKFYCLIILLCSDNNNAKTKESARGNEKKNTSKSNNVKNILSINLPFIRKVKKKMKKINLLIKLLPV